MGKRMLVLTSLFALAVMLTPADSQGLVIKKERPQLVLESISIFTGEVTALRSFWSGGPDKIILTEVTVKTEEYLKGYEGDVVKFTIHGGTVGDVTMTMSESPNFKVGEKVLLFLKATDCRLAGWYQGKYIIEGDMAYPAGPLCREKLDEDLAIPLEELLQEIRLLVVGGPIEPLSN
jgi:hypothetical protein